MKSILITALLFVTSFCGISQGRLLGTKNTIDPVTRMIMEGMPIDDAHTNGLGYTPDGTKTPGTDGYTEGGGFAIRLPISRAALIQGFTVWASDNVDYVATYGFSNSGSRGVVGQNGVFLYTGNAIAFPGDFIGISSPNGVIGTSATRKYVMQASAQGYKISYDLNWNATKSILFIGDSNLDGTSISATPWDSTSFADLWSYKVNSYYRNTWGQDVRVIDKSIGGRSSIDYDKFMKNNHLQLPEPPNLVFYALGTNDYDTAIFRKNVTSFLATKVKEWPTAKFIMLGPIPKQNSSVIDGVTVNNEVFLTYLRNIESSVVTSFANPNVIYINGGAAFTVSDNTQYSNTESDGSHAHISKVGHTTLANYITSQINGSHATFKQLGFDGFGLFFMVGFFISYLFRLLTQRRVKLKF